MKKPRVTDEVVQDNGLITECKMDGVKVGFIDPAWTETNVTSIIEGASIGSALLGVIDRYTPKYQIRGYITGAVIGGIVGGFFYCKVTKVGYYKRDSNGIATDECITEGRAYKVKNEVKWISGY